MSPTKSGIIVEDLDQVLIDSLLPDFFTDSAFFKRALSTNGPFQVDLVTYFLLFIINLLVFLLILVFLPLVGLPHGVDGCLPPEVLPSPPPWG